MLPLIISFLSLLLFNPVASKCVSRNSSLTTHQNPSPPSAQTLVPPPPIASRPPPPLAVPPPPSPPQAVPPPHVTTPPQNSPPKKTESSPKGFIGGIVSGVASSILSNACKQTDYPEICMETLTPFTVGLQSAKPDDPTALLKISIAAAVAETKSVIKAADKLMAENAGSASFVSILEDCRDNYNDALDNYQSALDAIPENDLGTINSMLSAAVTDYGTCDDGFMGTNPLINQDEKLSHMGSNCLVMASLLEHI